MDLGFEGRRVLVVGGSEGIGRAAASLMSTEGADVVIASRSERNLAAAAESIAPAASAVSGDMPADPAVQEAAAGTEPGLDVAPKKTSRKKASTAKTAGDA